MIFLVIHLNATFQAIQVGELKEPSRIKEDIRGFFSDEFTMEIWNDVATLHDADFVDFIESALAENPES